MLVHQRVLVLIGFCLANTNMVTCCLLILIYLGCLGVNVSLDFIPVMAGQQDDVVTGFRDLHKAGDMSCKFYLVTIVILSRGFRDKGQKREFPDAIHWDIQDSDQ